jgi:hypothetical protein
VRGRVFDSETGVGLRSVVLNLDGLTAVTQADGTFEFPVVKAATYRLSMDRSNVDVERVPAQPLPLDVEVVARGERQVEIPLVRTGAVNVVVTLRSAGSQGARNVLVTLRNGDVVYRRLTDEAGRIRLAGLKPGTWTATLAEETIPEGYSVRAPEQQLQVAPGGSAAAEFELTPIVREMRMLPPLQVQAR